MPDQQQDILQKLNEMHTDVLLIRSDLGRTQEEVEDHELILRGKSKVNGIVSEVKAMKTAQVTSNRLWLLMVSIIGTVVTWLGITK